MVTQSCLEVQGDYLIYFHIFASRAALPSTPFSNKAGFDPACLLGNEHTTPLSFAPLLGPRKLARRRSRLESTERSVLMGQKTEGTEADVEDDEFGNMNDE